MYFILCKFSINIYSSATVTLSLVAGLHLIIVIFKVVGNF